MRKINTFILLILILRFSTATKFHLLERSASDHKFKMVSDTCNKFTKQCQSSNQSQTNSDTAHSNVGLPRTKRNLKNMWYRCAEQEETTRMLEELLRRGLGTREVETDIAKQEEKLKGGGEIPKINKRFNNLKYNG